MNAVKSTSGKQGDLCMKESKSTKEIYDSHVTKDFSKTCAKSYESLAEPGLRLERMTSLVFPG